MSCDVVMIAILDASGETVVGVKVKVGLIVEERSLASSEVDHVSGE